MRDDNFWMYGKKNAGHSCNGHCRNAEGREIRRKQGDCCPISRALRQGKRRLATRLAQRWVKLQLGVLPA